MPADTLIVVIAITCVFGIFAASLMWADNYSRKS